MATVTIYSSTLDGYIEASSTTYATARAAVSGTANTSSASILCGQYNDGGTYYLYEGFLTFDTSGLPEGTITSATLRVNSCIDNSSLASACEARLYDWGESLTGSDTIPGGSLASAELLATLPASTNLVYPNSYELTSEAGFAAAINQAGSTRLVLHSENQRLGVAPTYDEDLGGILSANNIGTDLDPALILEVSQGVHLDFAATDAPDVFAAAGFSGEVTGDFAAAEAPPDVFSATGQPFVVTGSFSALESALDSLAASGNVLNVYEVHLQDALALSDTALAHLVARVFERLALGESPSAILAYTQLFWEDVLGLAEKRALRSTALLTDALALADGGGIGAVLLALQEQISLADSTLALLTATVALSQALTLAETCGAAYRLEQADEMALAESSTVLAQLLLALADSLPLSDEASFQFSVAVLVRDTLPLEEEVGWRIQALLAVSDTLALVGRVRLGDQEYLAWVINTSTGGAYKFTNYRFNSMARVGGKNLLCRADGIYEYGGEDDAGADITGLLKTGKLSLENAQAGFAGNTLKQLLSAYLLFSAEGETLLKIIISRRNVAEEHWYGMKESAKMAKRQLPVSNSLRSVLFQFQLEKLDGRPAAFKEIEVRPLYLTRSD